MKIDNKKINQDIAVCFIEKAYLSGKITEKKCKQLISYISGLAKKEDIELDSTSEKIRLEVEEIMKPIFSVNIEKLFASIKSEEKTKEDIEKEIEEKDAKEKEESDRKRHSKYKNRNAAYKIDEDPDVEIWTNSDENGFPCEYHYRKRNYFPPKEEEIHQQIDIVKKQKANKLDEKEPPIDWNKI